MNTPISPWISIPRRQPNADYRLFIFPHAGGWSTSYRQFARIAPPSIEVAFVEMPGRGLRIREEIPNDMTRLVHSIAYAVHLHIDRPSIFFGHSMGALVAFETHRYLAAHALRSCDELFVSACPAPRFMTTETGRFAWQRNGEDLVERLRRLGGTSNELLQNKEFLDVILPPYRADLDILASYQYRPANPLSCALTILGGRDDTSVDASELNAWRSETQKAATSHFFAGGHFYVFERAAEVMNHLAARAPGGDGAPTSMH